MRDDRPFPFAWDGEAMVPPGQYWAKRADERFVVGETYRLVEHHERSPQSHSHYFAALGEAWQTLPRHRTERWPTSEHLRKWALIHAGYRDERSIVAASKAEAQRIGAFMRPMDDYAVVVISECVVTVYTAKSQSMRAMGKAEFQKSKQDVLEIVARQIGVTAERLRANAGQAGEIDPELERQVANLSAG